jgi:hypothetical protein
MAFPSSPTNGQQAIVNGVVYNYNSDKGAWIKSTTTANVLSVASVIASGALTAANIVVSNASISGNLVSANVLIPAITGSGNVYYGMGVRRTALNRATSSWEYGTIASGLDVFGASGNAWSIDSAQGAGLFNLVAGAYHDTLTNSTGTSSIFRYFGTRGASRINLADNSIIFYTGNLANAGGQVAGDAVNFIESFRINGTDGNVVVNSNTVSTSSTTGALVVNGGVGVNGNLNVASRGITRQSMPAGSILQVVHVSKTNTFAGTSVPDNGGYFIDVTGMSATITPSSSTSKILVIADMYVGVTNTAGGYQTTYRLKRTISGVTTFPILGDTEGGRPRATGRINQYLATTAAQYQMSMMSGTHQDSPDTTSAITYQVQLGGYSGGPAVYLNRSETFQAQANDYDNVPVSTITLMEIAA